MGNPSTLSLDNLFSFVSYYVISETCKYNEMRVSKYCSQIKAINYLKKKNENFFKEGKQLGNNIQQ